MRPPLPPTVALSLALALGAAACAPEPPPGAASGPAPGAETALAAPDTLDLDAAFARRGGTGTLVLLDAATGATRRYRPARAAERLVPASTFKVYNALVALDAGAVAADLDTVQFRWDGTPQRVGAWAQDQSLRSAMQHSAVWAFQEIARRVGAAGYRAAFTRVPYGNGAVGNDVTRFWLAGPLAVSADEQVAFLDGLRRGALAFAPEAQAAARELIRLETRAAHTLYGKTGWAERDGRPDLGWFVGWVEGPGGAHVFALNMEPASTPAPDEFDMMTARRGLVEEALAARGLWPAAP